MFYEQEIVNYIDYVEQQTNEKVSSLQLSAQDGQVDIQYELQPQKLNASAASRATSWARSIVGTTRSAPKSTIASSTACIDCRIQKPLPSPRQRLSSCL